MGGVSNVISEGWTRTEGRTRHRGVTSHCRVSVGHCLSLLSDELVASETAMVFLFCSVLYTKFSQSPSVEQSASEVLETHCPQGQGPQAHHTTQSRWLLMLTQGQGAEQERQMTQNKHKFYSVV